MAILPIHDAIGLVLDRDLIVTEPVPRHATALQPGYAVASADLVGASPYSPAALDTVPPWIEVGDTLPSGCDAVLAGTVLERRGPVVEIVASCPPGDNVRRIGEDAAAGSVLREAGEVVRGIDVVVAQEAGLREVAVRRVLVRYVLDAQSEHFAALLRGIEGAQAEIVVHGSTRVETAGADLVLLLTRDGAVPQSLVGERCGAAAGLALRSAETVGVDIVAGVPVMVAPPRLDTILALLCGLVRPYVDGLSRRRTDEGRRATLRRKVSSTIGLTEVALVRETMGAVEPLSVGTLSLTALARADGYIVIPPESEGFQIGETVEVRRVL